MIQLPELSICSDFQVNPEAAMNQRKQNRDTIPVSSGVHQVNSLDSNSDLLTGINLLGRHVKFHDQIQCVCLVRNTG